MSEKIEGDDIETVRAELQKVTTERDEIREDANKLLTFARQLVARTEKGEVQINRVVDLLGEIARLRGVLESLAAGADISCIPGALAVASDPEDKATPAWHLAIEAACVVRCLDQQGIPRTENDKKLSLWGRVCCYKEKP